MNTVPERSRIAEAYPEFEWKATSSRVVTALEVTVVLLMIFGGLTILGGMLGFRSTPVDPKAMVAIFFGLTIVMSGIVVYSLSIMVRTMFSMDRHLQNMENIATILLERIDGIKR